MILTLSVVLIAASCSTGHLGLRARCGVPTVVTKEPKMSSERKSPRLRKPESLSPSSKTLDPALDDWLQSSCSSLFGIAASFERIADALEQWVKLEAQRYEQEYPAKQITPVTVQTFRRPQQDEHPELAKPGEDLFEGLGPRERKLAEKRFAKQKVRGASQARN